MHPRWIARDRAVASMAYTHCKTRTVDLKSFDIPDTATEAEYKQLYDQISASQTPVAQALTDAVSSISLGIAPPVAFPTETVYGLGADATNHAATAGIFAAKGRPNDNPLIVHVASRDHLERLTGTSIPEIYRDLVRDHWPGPLTILVPVADSDDGDSASPFAANVHPGQQTIGFRVPSSKYARFFIAATDRPIAAPSANSSGKPSPTTAQHVLDDLTGKINFVLDGGPCDVGLESTVVDGLHSPPLILRPGGLSQDDLVAHGQKYGNAWADVALGYTHGKDHANTPQSSPSDNDADTTAPTPRAPGMKYKHYAPRGQMLLFEGPPEHTTTQIKLELDTILSTPTSAPIALLTTTTWSTSPPPLPSATTIHKIHLGTTPREIARTLFAALRQCDDLGCGVILAEAPWERRQEGEEKFRFDAVLERMRKAASRVVGA